MTAPAHRRLRTASTLGVVQILNWGASYYLLAILAAPIAAETGWPMTLVAGGLSIGLVTAGLVAPTAGGRIAVHGGRPVLAVAAALIALGLVVMATAGSAPVYLAAWAIIGVGMGAGLYDAAFAALGRLFGKDAGRGIAILTLWGGFASTVCWPLSAVLVEAFGWRGTALAYAALELGLVLPLCLLALPREAARPPPPKARAARGAGGGWRFAVLATAAVAVAAIMSAWSVHLIAVLQGTGLTLAAAVAAAALIGPAQVGGRLAQVLTGDRLHPVATMLVAAALILAGFACLATGAPAALALVAYGAGNGIWSIARGTVPLALFGSDDYPVLIGRLAMPALLAAAAAPIAMAEIIVRFGPHAALGSLVALATVPVAAALALAANR